MRGFRQSAYEKFNSPMNTSQMSSGQLSEYESEGDEYSSRKTLKDSIRYKYVGICAIVALGTLRTSCL